MCAATAPSAAAEAAAAAGAATAQRSSSARTGRARVVPTPAAAGSNNGAAAAAAAAGVAAEIVLVVGARIGAYFKVDNKRTLWYDGQVQACSGSICTVQFEDGQPWDYPVKDFIVLPAGSSRPSCAHLGGKPCVFAGPTQRSSTVTVPVPSNAVTGQGGAYGSNQQGAGSSNAPPVPPACSVAHERRDMCLAYNMHVSSKHGLNYVVNVARSIITPVRMSAMSAKDGGVFLLHPDDERYADKHIQRMSANARQQGSKGATERAHTDFSARKLA